MATLPYRINTVTIKIKQMQTGSSAMHEDPDFAEPAAPIEFGSEITVQGQVNLMNRNYEQFFMSLTGNKKIANGHLVIKGPITDTGGTLITLRPGDKVTEIAGVTVNYFLKEVRPESPLNGSFLLWYCEFTENDETRESN